MNLERKTSPLFLGCAALALFACTRDRRGDVDVDRSGVRNSVDNAVSETRAGEATLTGARVAGMSNEAAIDRIVSARCQREATCNNVGVKKKYADRMVCTQEIRTKMRDELKASECPRGIDAKELDECLEAIQKESCGNPIEAVERVAACRTSDLCLATDERNR